MADIKTNLRELSVAATIKLLTNNVKFSFDELCDLDYFLKVINEAITNRITSDMICNCEKFNHELCEIIRNGYKLGCEIYSRNEFAVDDKSEIVWKGYDTQKDDPVDLEIGKYKFSLKEDSFILENMGLYKLLNCFTGSTYKKRHIFKDYANSEYEKWFSVTWQEMIRIIKSQNCFWRLVNKDKGKTATIKISNDSVELTFEKGSNVKKCCLPVSCSLSYFEKKTNSKIREEVFAKFINNLLSDNSNYTIAKRECAKVATCNLAKELTENLNYNEGLLRFLRVHNFEYYYAKTTVNGISIYRVPSVSDFKNEIVIDSIQPSVPNSQANILTTIRNKKTEKTLILRNECRFSHGQFNGTPEAKMYYENGGSLLTIYESI